MSLILLIAIKASSSLNVYTLSLIFDFTSSTFVTACASKFAALVNLAEEFVSPVVV